ncbi:hypothetical protein CHS0354_031639 [Potamilus streckersoni]|uniref:Uncharacterized protein n=1 Tax=Potamilus streckersoni TaxID=2493646 RepID=A0AAE0SH05_9BIVA|nr:hypothetical protein CHS0354_031639 [Potamilus streckersoni]
MENLWTTQDSCCQDLNQRMTADVAIVQGMTADVAIMQGMATDVAIMQGMTADVAIVQGMTVIVAIMQGMATDVAIMQGMATDVAIMQGMTADVAIVQGMTVIVAIMQGMATDVAIMQGMTADVAIVQGMTEDVAIVQGMTADVVIVQGMTADVAIVHGMTAYVAIMQGMTAYVAIVQGMSHFGTKTDTTRYETNSTVFRARSAYNVTLLRSQTGLTILKGGKFHDRTLAKQLRRITQDAHVEIRILSRQQKSIWKRNDSNLNRSQKLVKLYNLPPLKSGSITLSSRPIETREEITKEIPMERSQQQQLDSKSQKSPRQMDSKIPKSARIQQDGTLTGNVHHMRMKPEHLLQRRHLANEANESRRFMYSPVPQQGTEDSVVKTSIRNVRTKETHMLVSPEITVERCEETLPSIHTRSLTNEEQSLQPEYARSSSSNNLLVPGSCVQHRRQDGRIVILTNLERGMSRSEGSIPDSVNKDLRGVLDPRFKALEAVLKPLSVSRARTSLSAEGIPTSVLYSKCFHKRLS